MRRWLRTFAFIVLIVCPPIQAWAAVAQPFCAMQAPTSAGDEHAMHGNHDMPSAPQAPIDHDCDNCTLCHLGCSSALISVAIDVAELPRPTFDVVRLSAISDFLRKPLLRPPLV